jgi:hypothetical protein
MPQEKIQEWVERIYMHVQEVILLEGVNEYKEGRCKGQLKKKVHWIVKKKIYPQNARPNPLPL